MGGRNKPSSKNASQSSFNDEITRIEVSKIIKESEIKRKALIGKEGSSGGSSSPQLYKKCMCCGEYTIPVKTEYETCPKCGWIDDPFQNRIPKSLEGKNEISLLQAKELYSLKKK